MGEENIIQMKWKRPMTIEYPKVWSRFQARDLNSDKSVEYRIEDLTEDRAEDAYQHMRDNYLAGEPVTVALGKNRFARLNDVLLNQIHEPILLF